jgi:arginine repressor
MRKVFSMPKKGQQYTTMTDEVRLTLVRYKKDHPSATQKELIKWLEDTHQLKVSQATMSGTLKQSAELLAKVTTSNLSSKR